jgi:hypothetical protein
MARRPRRSAAHAIARPWLPADAVAIVVPGPDVSATRSAAFSAPRDLNDEVACRLSSFNRTSP